LPGHRSNAELKIKCRKLFFNSFIRSQQDKEIREHSDQGQAEKNIEKDLPTQSIKLEGANIPNRDEVRSPRVSPLVLLIRVTQLQKMNIDNQLISEKNLRKWQKRRKQENILTFNRKRMLVRDMDKLKAEATKAAGCKLENFKCKM